MGLIQDMLADVFECRSACIAIACVNGVYAGMIIDIIFMEYFRL